MTFIRDEETGKIVDRERNITLRSVKGYSTGHAGWEIDWDDEIIGFMSKDTTTYGGERKNTPIAIDWFIESMKIPESLKA